MSMPINVIMRINNIAYKQSVPAKLKVGDLVYDIKLNGDMANEFNNMQEDAEHEEDYL